MNGWEYDGPGTQPRIRRKNPDHANIVPFVTVREWCPVGELAGDPHEYVAGDGVVIPWDVAGDPRPGVEVCAECAVHHAPDENPPCETCHYPASDHVAGACVVSS